MDRLAARYLEAADAVWNQHNQGLSLEQWAVVFGLSKVKLDGLRAYLVSQGIIGEAC